MNGLAWLFWGIAIALPLWFFVWRRWAGMHDTDATLSKRHHVTYIEPTMNGKTIDRF
jgi:hypothetical protein